MRPARRPLVAGNWKMYLTHLEAIAHTQKLAFTLGREELAAVEVVLLPPFTDLRSVQTLVHADRLAFGFGAQDLSPHDAGAYTGDVSGTMLAALGCGYVVVGHSERRAYHGETDSVVAAKVAAAYRHGLAPILCVGEGEEVRRTGGHVEWVLAQLAVAVDGLAAEQMTRLVIAYEPIWAIGTGAVATPEDAQQMCAAVRELLARRVGRGPAAAARVLYGGSVKAGNAGDLFAGADVDGALVGGASLATEDFAAIVRAVAGL
ncbi:MAG: triose-phosphate isomerase [Mycobacteriales bacterium]